jgi:NADPH:quinone reductase-like Zn-dependent oxidoreductase
MLIIVGGEGGGRVFGGLGRQLRASLWSIFIPQRMRSYLSSEHAEDLAVISDLIEAGSVTPAIERTYPLSEAAEAIDRQHAGHVGGKLVLVI